MKAGDIVQLKSGGVVMTIERIVDGFVYCEWYNPITGLFCSRSFLEIQLTIKQTTDAKV